MQLLGPQLGVYGTSRWCSVWLLFFFAVGGGEIQPSRARNTGPPESTAERLIQAEADRTQAVREAIIAALVGVLGVDLGRESKPLASLVHYLQMSWQVGPT